MKTLNRKLKPLTKKMRKKIGVVPRALKYFVLLSVVLHASLIFVGRQLGLSLATKPAEVQPHVDRIQLPAQAAARIVAPFHLNLTSLKTSPTPRTAARLATRHSAKSSRGHRRKFKSS